MLVGEGELKLAMKHKAERLGISESVMFLSKRDDVADLYQAMNYLILPSLYEGLGMVAIEVQVAGLPYILSTEVPQEAIVRDMDEWDIRSAAVELSERYKGLSSVQRRFRMNAPSNTKGWLNR